jgi:CHAD domain-containing protein
MTVREYARFEAGRLLDSLNKEVGRAGRNSNPEAVHDLRVSIRRFSECLRLFEEFLPARRIGRRLKRIMDDAAAVRDRDVVLEFLADAHVDAPKAVRAIERERRSAEDALRTRLTAWKKRSIADKWRSELEL